MGRGLLPKFLVLEHTLVSLLETEINQQNSVIFADKMFMIRAGSLQRSREQGLNAPPAWYVPRDEADYYMQTGKLPKALAANAAYADLTGIRVPHRQEDGTFIDAEGDVMSHDDMADYFTRLRAARAPPVPAAAAPPPAQPAPPPLIIAEPTNNGKRRKVQQTLDGMV